MAGIFEAVLAAVGLVLLVVMAFDTRSNMPAGPAAEEDPAAIYREGLRASVTIQETAQDLERRIYAAAADNAPGKAPADDSSEADEEWHGHA